MYCLVVYKFVKINPKWINTAIWISPGSEIRGESENPFSQRFPPSHQRESKQILAKFKNLYNISICENPQILAKTIMENLNGFSHSVTNFYPWSLLCYLSDVQIMMITGICVWLPIIKAIDKTPLAWKLDGGKTAGMKVKNGIVFQSSK